MTEAALPDALLERALAALTDQLTEARRENQALHVRIETLMTKLELALAAALAPPGLAPEPAPAPAPDP